MIILLMSSFFLFLIYIYIYICIYNHLREFGFKLSVIAAPLREVPLALPAVSRSGPDGTHVAQTLCFPGFNAGPPPQLAFKAFSV